MSTVLWIAAGICLAWLAAALGYAAGWRARAREAELELAAALELAREITESRDEALRIARQLHSIASENRIVL